MVPPDDDAAGPDRISRCCATADEAADEPLITP
jgi:hypothetical protein